MKSTFLVAACVLLLSTASFAQDTLQPRLAVHEWGTFTLVSGSDGVPIPWWQSLGLIQQDLPPFVAPNLLASKAAPALVRMETPVLYFYPSAPVEVEITAEMKNGRITEWYPAPAAALFTGSGMQGNRVTWKASLYPPDDPASLAAIPPANGPAGIHYSRARQVPAAWLVRSNRLNFGAEFQPRSVIEMEKFIFYRGAANFQPPWRPLVAPDGTLQLAAREGAPKIEHSLTIRNDGEPTAASIEEWRGQMLAALVKSGLTTDEARAMIATWNDHWFAEHGHRILAILPQAWVDTVLPLTIKPFPEKLIRVFVARFEMLSPETERRLGDLLKEVVFVEAATPGQQERFRTFQLGRFASAALERVKAVHKDENITQQQWHDAFQKLRTPPENSPESPSRSGRGT